AAASPPQGCSDRHEAAWPAAGPQAQGCGAVLVLTPEIPDAAITGRVGVPVRGAFGLGAIQLAGALGWLAYAHFQPRILDDIGLSRLDTLLSVYVAAVGAMLGPLAGGLADLTVRRAGSRFPVVLAGGFLAGVLFVAVALAIGPYAPGPLRDAIPMLIVLWIAALIVLQAPSLALAGDLSRPELLPAVASMVVATMLPLAVGP